MKTQNRMIENPIIKDKVTFVKTSEETNGEYLLAQIELAPHGGNLMHYHTAFTEKFEVLDGQLNVIIGGKLQVLEAGQTALVPPKAHHRFYSTSDTPVTFMIEFRPPGQVEKAMRIGYGLAKDGYVNSKGIPSNFWHIALFIQLVETYFPGPPLVIQQALFGTLARIAKWRGVDKTLAKYL